MARKPSKSKIPSDGYSFLRRLYAVLPWVLFAVVGFNLWFIFSYVRRERVVVDSVRDRVLGSVSNALQFVHNSLSNEIISARLVISNDLEVMRARMLALSTSLRVSSTNSPSPSYSSPVHDNVLPLSGDVPASYLVAAGSPMIDLSGSYYSVGDDFGYGRIEAISKMFVICDGRKYRLSLVRSLPSIALNRQPVKKEDSVNE